LIIYESATNNGNLGEFRSVREVDGKKVTDGDKRAVKVFAKLAAAKSFEEELRKLNKESSRYDEDFSFYGLTLFQAVSWVSNYIPSFKFVETGRETIEGIDAIAVKFQQTIVDPNIILNIDVPDILKATNKFYRRIVWLDLKTYRILKLLTEMTFDSPKFTEPFVIIKTEYFYQPSDFGIYPPRKIVTKSFNPKAEKSTEFLLKNGEVKPDSKLQTRLTMEYKNFSKFDVTVKSAN